MKLAATAALIVATSTSVFAQPATVPPQPVQTAPNGAPQNEDWSNVSHINGTPVKVGERDEYLFTQKKFNITSNPIGWMIGFYGLSGSYAVSDHIALRADANLFSFDHERGYEVGLSAPIYLKRTYQGVFIEPGIAARGFRQTEFQDCYDCSYETSNDEMDTSFGPEMMVGYHATFDSGLNAAIAFGLLRNMNAQHDEYASDIEPTGYFRVGYAF